jgi:hypothetical protein
MAQFVETPTKTMFAAGAIPAHRRVITPTALVLAGLNDLEVGTMDMPCLAAGPTTVRLRTAQGTQKFVANGVIAAGADVFAAADGKVAATGIQFVGTSLEAAGADGQVIEVLRGTRVGSNTIRQRFTIAQINAGATLLPAVPGRRYRMIDCEMIAIGGNASGATTVDLLATQSAASVKLIAAAVAGLTANSLLRVGATNSAILAGGVSFVANDLNTAITVGKTGSDLATSTHVDFVLTYELA